MSDWGTCATCDAEAGIDRRALRQSAPELTAEQAVNSERYWEAVRANTRRRRFVDYPGREAMLADLREAIRRVGGA